MSPLIVALYMASAASLTVGLLSGAVWMIRRSHAYYGWFGLAAIASGVASLAEARLYVAGGIDTYVSALRWQVAFLAVFLAAFAWFIKEYGRVERNRLAFAVLVVVTALLIVNFLSPFTLLYDQVTGLRSIELPWGEVIVFAEGRPQAIWPLATLPGVLIVILFVVGARKLWRTGERRRVAVLSAAFAPFAVAFWVLGPLSEFGVIEAPYMFSFAYLVLVLFVGSELALDVARAADLSGEMRESQRRWRALLDHVDLFVTEVDNVGRIAYVNPYFSRVTGWSEKDVVGRHIADLVSDEDRTQVEELYSAPERADAPLEVAFRSRDGRRRAAMWVKVPLLDPAGDMTGLVSLGVDVTDQREAEVARDEAIRELEELRRQLEEENLFLRQELESSHGFEEIVGDSDALRYVLFRVEQVAGTDATVLIEGETGVGKGLIARAIHRRSTRSEGSFITVDCGTLPPNLVETELFGHERGAFTGATRARKGRFELADGGTLFLDEIGELSPDLQIKLLRVLDTSEFTPVGASRPRRVDVRIVAATNRRLETEVESGRLREDLFYRIHVYPITVPPLRERREDIPALVHHFIRRLNLQLGKSIDSVPGPTLRRLVEYSWPGNIRELENVLERSVILSEGSVLILPPGFDANRRNHVSGLTASSYRSLAAVEREHIESVLEATEWKIEGDDGAAARLGLKPSTLRSRLKKHGIHRNS